MSGPVNADEKIEPAIATLYRATVSMGTQETSLVWMRYAGFLVLNGFVLNVTLTRHFFAKPLLVGVLGIVGLLINGTWHLLNYAGWLHQNYWYHKASNLLPKKNGNPYPTDSFRDEVKQPSGTIYQVAQVIPMLFLLAFSVFVSWACFVAGCGWACSIIMAVSVFVLTMCAVKSRENGVLLPDGRTSTDGHVTLYRPTGPEEMELVRQSGFRAWPPRLPGQPIFYPVTNEAYAKEITERWNVSEKRVGYVTRFRVRKSLMDRYKIQRVGAAHHTEWWIPAGDLAELNRNIVGLIEVVGEYRAAVSS
jgi:hypothetical protein